MARYDDIGTAYRESIKISPQGRRNRMVSKSDKLKSPQGAVG